MAEFLPASSGVRPSETTPKIHTNLLSCSYNSVIFKAQSAFPNYTSFVGEDFTKGAQWSISTGVDTTSYGYRGPVITNSPSINAASENLRYLQANIAKLEQRDVSSCVYAFRSPYVPNYINYLFVSKVGYTNFNGSKSALYDITRNLPGSPGFPKSSGDKWGTDYSSSGDTNVFREMDEWFFNTDYSSFKHSKLPSIKVDYCLAEQTTARCSIRVYQPLIIVVIAFNAVKVAALIATMVMSRTFSPLVTVGDAVSSFLGRSDPITAELGPISFDEIRKRIHNARRFTSDNCPIHGNQPGSKWMVRSRHWVRTVEDPRMSMFIIV